MLSDIEAERDVGDFQGYMLKESYWRHVPIEVPTAESVTDFLRGQIRAQVDSPRRTYYLAVRHRVSGDFIGEASLRLWDAVSGDCGWGVDDPWRGQGFATEIGAAMLQLGFARHGLHRLCAFCHVGNEASRRVMTKLGMQSEGIAREHLRVRGAWWSSWAFSILSTDPQPARIAVDLAT